MRDDQSMRLTGYICPHCGGALSQQSNRNGAGDYQCRIDHAFTSAQIWIEHCVMRNRALGAAARAVAENVDLARALAEQARTLGDDTLAARLEDEARTEERHVGQILEMLEELGIDDSGAESGPDH